MLISTMWFKDTLSWNEFTSLGKEIHLQHRLQTNLHGYFTTQIAHHIFSQNKQTHTHMYRFDVQVDFDSHPQYTSRNKHAFSDYPQHQKQILNKADLTHMLNLITLFTVSVHSWMCFSATAAFISPLLLRFILLPKSQVTGHFSRAPPHKPSSQRTLRAESFDGNSTRHTQVSYIQPEYETAEGEKKAVKSYRYRY